MTVIKKISRFFNIAFVRLRWFNLKEKGICIVKINQSLDRRRYFSSLTQQVINSPFRQGITAKALFIYCLGQFKE